MMKPSHILSTSTAALAAICLALVGCEEKRKAVPHDHDGDGVPDHGPEAHGRAVPQSKAVPHDHDGDGKPDHGPGAHDDHSGHDHGEASGHSHDDGHDHAQSGDHDGHDHAKKTAGPNGGRVLTVVEPHAEFLATPDRKVRITFLDDENHAVPLAGQSVNVVCGDRAKPTMLDFTQTDDGKSLISTGTLPEGNNFPTIVTIKTKPDAAPQRAKFFLNLDDCDSCKHKEYACTCDHGHEH